LYRYSVVLLRLGIVLDRDGVGVYKLNAVDP
jgi:hypothetical protein